MIKKIIIEIGGKDIEMSKDEAIKLRDDLNEVWPVYSPPVMVPSVWPEIYPTYPTYPTYPIYPMYTTTTTTLDK